MNYLRCLLFVFFPLPLLASSPIIASKMVEKGKVSFRLVEEFHHTYVSNDLTLTYPSGVNLEQLPPSIVDVPLITNVIAAIWFSGKEYTIDEMDKDLYYSLIKVKEVFRRFFCNTAWDGELIPNRLVKNIPPTRNSRPGLLFTGGLDSTATLFHHWEENPILISFNAPNKHASGFAKKYQFDFVTIEANHENFLNRAYLNKVSCDITDWLWKTSLGLSWIGLATPLLYSFGIPSLYISADHSWGGFIFPDGETIKGMDHPIADENISPMGLIVKHALFEMTRDEKVKYISDFCLNRNMPKPRLTVCISNKNYNNISFNCNRCEKCYRTMLNIVATGNNPRDFGFFLSPDRFIHKFMPFIKKYKNLREYYSVYHSSQNYILKNIDSLPPEYLSFYKWYLSLDLWKIVDEPPCPRRDHPFSWEDYKDLYPEMPENV